MRDLPDHPVIHNMERTGYPDGKEPRRAICPNCGEEADTFVITWDNRVVGCENCLKETDAQVYADSMEVS